MIAAAVARTSEATARKQLGVQHWIDDLSWQQANERLVSQPTVNIEGLVGGYTGPGGKTVLPHRAVAKIDMRLVPGMKMDDAVAAFKPHLASRLYCSLLVNVFGVYASTSTPVAPRLFQSLLSFLLLLLLLPLLFPPLACSFPLFVFSHPPFFLSSFPF